MALRKERKSKCASDRERELWTEVMLLFATDEEVSNDHLTLSLSLARRFPFATPSVCNPTT